MSTTNTTPVLLRAHAEQPDLRQVVLGLVPPARIEPATSTLGKLRSILLSYGGLGPGVYPGIAQGSTEPPPSCGAAAGASGAERVA
jgi:hypothetical protein